ncbi:MAG: DUF2789 domain-containing protein [Pseudomonadota bacterium]
MEASIHTLNNLFAQLGLSSDQVAIENFIKTHSPLATNILLADAAFWTPAQASFLREEILNDADWAEVIDQLNARLHAK